MSGYSRDHTDPLAPPPCPMTKYYLSYLDLLDSPYFLHHEDHSVPQAHDVSMVERLQAHLMTCAICTANVQQLRRIRSQQRAILHDILLDNEWQVPSSVASIMELVRREQPVLPATNHAQMNGTFTVVHEESLSRLLEEKPGQETSAHPRISANPHKLSLILRTIFSVAVVVVLLISTLLISNQFIMVRTPSSHSTGTVSHRVIYSSYWGSVVMSRTLHGQTSIANYNPYNGHHTALVPPFTADALRIDGVSRDGHDLLYQYSSHNYTYYATLNPLGRQGYFYALGNENAGEAIWMSDSRHVLIAAPNEGIVEVDSHTGTAQTVAQITHVRHLWFYRDNYLYFDYATPIPARSSDLWRVNIVTATPERVLKTTNARSYFLSPDGTTVFYVDTDRDRASQEARTAIFTMNVHTLGTPPQVLLPLAAVPVGFAQDDALELVQEVHNTYQLVKLAPTRPTIDRVVMDDVAPNAVALCDHPNMDNASICDENIALAPYSGGMIVVGLNKDGSRQIWADDLLTGTHLPLITLSSNDTTQVQLPGWDRILV